MLSNFFDRIKLPFRKEKELYVSLYRIIGFYPHNIELYKTALLHKSIARRNEKGKPVNNERLEFLGDAILDAVVGYIVFKHFPGKREGFLTNTRSKLVQRETLGRLAQEMGINELILSNSRGQSHNSYMGGNAFEALVGAIYLDRGYDACMRFMQNRILKQMINIDKVAYKEVNFKSKLLEWTQKNRVRMEFRLLNQEKDKQGSPTFCYQVVIEGIEGCKGNGYSKKESQQMASKLTLEQLRKKPQFVDAVFAAKSDRTKMEEEPAMAVPRTDEQEDFIVVSSSPAPAPQVVEKPEPVKEEKPRQAEKPKAPEKQKVAEKPKTSEKAKPAEKQKAAEQKPAEKQKAAEQKPTEKQKAAEQKPIEKQKVAEQKPAASDQKPAAKPGRKSKARPEGNNEVQPAKESKVRPEADSEAQPAKDSKPKAERQKKNKAAAQKTKAPKPVAEAPVASPVDDDDEFDLSDISAREQTREEIIAAAEAQAFAAAE